MGVFLAPAPSLLGRCLSHSIPSPAVTVSPITENLTARGPDSEQHRSSRGVCGPHGASRAGSGFGVSEETVRVLGEVPVLRCLVFVAVASYVFATRVGCVRDRGGLHRSPPFHGWPRCVVAGGLGCAEAFWL